MSNRIKVPSETDASPVAATDKPKNLLSKRLILDSRFSINGIIKYDGDLQIDGHMDADIQCKRLFVGAAASITGVIVTGMIEVFGEVKGEVFADLVILRSTSHVEAELTYRALELDPGSYFEGRSRRSADPFLECPSFELSSYDDISS